MDLAAHMVRNKPHDTFGIGRGHAVTGVFQTTGEPVDPDPAVGIEHDFDNARIFKIARYYRPQGGAQHARTSGKRFSLNGTGIHIGPQKSLQNAAFNEVEKKVPYRARINNGIGIVILEPTKRTNRQNCHKTAPDHHATPSNQPLQCGSHPHRTF